MLSHARFSATPWTVACQAPLFHGILQARILEWVAILFSRSSQPRDWTQVSCIVADSLLSEPPGKTYKGKDETKILKKSEEESHDLTLIRSMNNTCLQVCVLSPFSCVRLFATLWTLACQALLSKGFSRQEYWSGLLCPPAGDLPHLGIKPVSQTSTCISRLVLYH